MKPDLDKIKLGFLRRMEIARTHCINIKSLLRYELTDNSFFLSPDRCFLSKSKKADLQPLLKTRSVPTSDVTIDNKRSIVLIDFMSQARKIESRREVWAKNFR